MALAQRLEQLEAAVSENVGTLFRNNQQLKHGLDAAEVNQRAISKVVQALYVVSLTTWPASLSEASGTVFPVQTLEGGIDWGYYYRAAEDDIEAEHVQAYKNELKMLKEKVDALEPELPSFEAEVRKELGSAAPTPRTQAVDRFFSDLKREIAKVHQQHQTAVVENNFDPKTGKFEQVNVKVIMDAVFMAARAKAKKEAVEAKTAKPVVVETATQETVVEFGG